MATSSSAFTTAILRLLLAAAICIRFLAKGQGDEHGDEDDHHDEHEGEEEDHYNNSTMMTYNGTSAASEFDDSHDAAAAAASETTTEQQQQTQPWGDVILASLIIQTVTITGLVLSITIKNCCGGKNPISYFWILLRYLIIPSFAGGALLATTVFLIIPEALNLVPLTASSEEAKNHDEHEGEDEDAHRSRYLQEDVHEEPDQPWKVGTAILGGFLFPMMFWILFPGNHHHGGGGDKKEHQAQHDVAMQNELDKSKGDNPTTQSPSTSSDDRVADMTKRMDSDREEYDDDYEYNDDGKVIPLTSMKTTSVVSEAPKVLAASSTAPDEKEGVVVQTVDDVTKASPILPPRNINYALASSILVGDFFHNFTDGVFLGSAFSTCSRELGYTLVATTVYHELAQEIADFFLLTHHCGLLEWEAFVLNFCSGFSVMIGALMILALDMSDKSKGIILALSAGVYLHIAASECIPRAQSYCKTSKDALIFLLFFILGAVPIGLVLLNHGHCEA